MGAYLVRRGVHGLIAILGVSLVVFFLLRLSGDPVLLLVGEEATDEQITAVRENLGLDRPIFVQLGLFFAQALTGDFGYSAFHNASATSVVFAHVPATLQLALTAFALAIVVGVPLGMISALRRNSFVDRAMVLVSTLGQAVPHFWLGLMLVMVFSVQLQWLPVSGRQSALSLILPAITLAGLPMARTARIVRTSMLEVLGREYVTTAEAKGLSAYRVLTRHIFRNALVPTVTLLALDFAYLINGSVVVETVFAWPGVGRLVTASIYNRDYAVVQATVFFIAVTYVVINLIVDVMYTRLDPRVRYD